MGSMPASDAAPLPRHGEVYFDVRGESRSMRLSWYADTGVAVFSIWQGGTCTGTFRLPIADLPRMIDALRRGPGDPRDGYPGDPGPRQALAGDAGGYREEPAYSYRDEPPTGVYRKDPLDPDAGGHPGDPRGRYPGDPGPGQALAGDAGGYREEPAYSYRDEPSTGVYRKDPLDPDAGGHPGDPRGRYPGDPRDGYPSDPHGGYREEPTPGDYPTGLSDSAIDDPNGLPTAANAGYSPGRPYAVPLPGDTRGMGEGRGGRHRDVRRDESDPSSRFLPL